MEASGLAGLLTLSQRISETQVGRGRDRKTRGQGRLWHVRVWGAGGIGRDVGFPCWSPGCQFEEGSFCAGPDGLTAADRGSNPAAQMLEQKQIPFFLVL